MKHLPHVLAVLIGATAAHTSAEQFLQIEDYRAHYMILDTLSLEPEIAASYGIVRARNQSILTLSILNVEGAAVPTHVKGSTTNLLGRMPSPRVNRSRVILALLFWRGSHTRINLDG